jgi:hypothetical protein
MKRKDIKIGMEVAIASRDYELDNPTFAVVTETSADYQLYGRKHGYIRGSKSQVPGVRVKYLKANYKGDFVEEVVALTSVKDADEVRQIAAARKARRNESSQREASLKERRELLVERAAEFDVRLEGAWDSGGHGFISYKVSISLSDLEKLLNAAEGR